MAHKSLSLKLKARNRSNKLEQSLQKSSSDDNLIHSMNAATPKKDDNLNFINAEMKILHYENNEIKDQGQSLSYQKRFLESNDENEIHMNIRELLDTRVDKVYTVGCFDLFHHGHIKLIQRMRKIGKIVVVGVHDSRSIYKLKNRVPVDSTTLRMINVKSHADVVFCISGTDPSNYMTCIVNLKDNETALYVRGDDMPDFPSKTVVENLMPIKYLPYTG